MDFRHLRQFVVLAETLNFRKAAEKLHMSQPPLSVSIRKLEAELGVELFHRGKNGVRLTKSGEAALQDARRALFHAGEFVQSARAATKGERGVLRIGFVGSATHSILPVIVPLFRQRYPGVQLILRESKSVQIIDALENGTQDIGILRTPVPCRTQLQMQTLQTENLILVVPRNHALASVASVRMADLRHQDFIFYAHEAHGLRMAALHACEAHGFTPRITQEALQVATLISLVEAGLGVALVPSISRQSSGGQKVAWKTIADFPHSASIAIALAWRPNDETLLIRNFQAVAQAAFPQDSGPGSSNVMAD
ncbi:MAG: LysR family transcriptional regulator [Alcaligenaceae bacterium]|nr:LysR family transcriptional regulator [Alcaligenaceae bacterium]